MAKSLLEQLPKIVAEGKQQAERILEGLEGRRRVGLQTREWVLPSRDVSAKDWIADQSRLAHLRDGGADAWTNRLIYGDNLLAMAALLAGDEHTPSLRGKVDLIYIDPPFDSKADYRTKVTLPGLELEQRPTVIEQFAYSDTWSDGTASYLAMITPLFVLMRELLTGTGQIYVHLDWHVSHYVKLVLDDVFGKEKFRNEIVWCYSGGATSKRDFPRKHDVLLRYVKGDSWVYEPVYKPYAENTQQVGKVSTYNLGSRESLDIDLDRGTPVTDWWTDIKTVTGWATESWTTKHRSHPCFWSASSPHLPRVMLWYLIASAARAPPPPSPKNSVAAGSPPISASPPA